MKTPVHPTLAGVALLSATIIPAGWLMQLSLQARDAGTAELADGFRLWLLIGYPVWTVLWLINARIWWNRPLPMKSTRVLLVAIPSIVLISGIFVEPLLSDDMWRYAWEGRVILSGHNPYAHAPSSPELAELAGRYHNLHQRVNNPNLSAIYPPLAQVVFAAVAITGQGISALKLAFCGMALLSMLCIHRWLQHRNLPTGRTLAFASHPLLAIEIGYSGHLDAMMLLATAAMVMAAASQTNNSRASAISSSFAMAAAVLTKLAPAALLPHLILHQRAWKHRVAMVLMVTGLVALAYVPFASAGSDLFSTLGTYNRNWEFNGPLNRGLVMALYAVDNEGTALMAPFDMIGRLISHDDLGDRLLASKGYEPIHPAAFLARLVAASLFAIVWAWMLFRRRPFHEQWLVVVGAGLLLSPVVHPWYLLTLLPAAFGGGALSAAALWWSLTIPLTYAVLPRWWSEEVWKLPGWVMGLEYGGMIVVAVAAARLKPPGRRGHGLTNHGMPPIRNS